MDAEQSKFRSDILGRRYGVAEPVDAVAVVAVDSVRVDLEYAIRQLRRFGDVERALDALERVKAALEAE